MQELVSTDLPRVRPGEPAGCRDACRLWRRSGWRICAGRMAVSALNAKYERIVSAVERVPGFVPRVLSDALARDGVALLRAEDRVFEAMLDGWRAQMLARGLTAGWIK